MIRDDEVLLAGIREVFEAIDPVPPDLAERIRFSVALRDLDAEVARLADEADELALVARGTEESRTITFDSDSLTIMVRIDSNADGSVRVDGWLAPPQARPVEMRMADSCITVTADEMGRFVFAKVPRGTVRVVVCAVGAAAGCGDTPRAAKSVITPAMILLGRG